MEVVSGRGPEVVVTCDECRSSFDSEPAVCASCLKAEKEKTEKLERLLEDARTELDETREELAGARSALEDLAAKDDEHLRLINRLLEDVHRKPTGTG